MPKVGCFWPGLFKSSNCLFPWAAGETGKCSFLQHNSHFRTGESGLGEMAAPSAGTAPALGCAAPLCRALLGGFLPRGSPRVSSRLDCSATSHPLLGHPKHQLTFPSLAWTPFKHHQPRSGRTPAEAAITHPAPGPRSSSICLPIKRDTAPLTNSHPPAPSVASIPHVFLPCHPASRSPR